MSHSLSIRLNDDVFHTLQQQAVAAGTSPEELAAASLQREYRAIRGERSEGDLQAARERFERHFGEVGLDTPSGSDNESIDADLARQYADTHEAERC